MKSFFLPAALLLFGFNNGQKLLIIDGLVSDSGGGTKITAADSVTVLREAGTGWSTFSLPRTQVMTTDIIIPDELPPALYNAKVKRQMRQP